MSERKFDGGEKLIRELLARGLVLAGACWASTEEAGRPYLYLLAPDAAEGSGSGYLKVRQVIADFDARKVWAHWLERIDGFDVMVVGPERDVGKALAREYRQYSGDDPTLLYNWIDTIPIEGAAMIYPPGLFAQPAPAAG